MGDVGRVEVTDGDLGDGRVEEKLVFREVDVVGFSRREDDSVGAFFQSGFKLSMVNHCLKGCGSSLHLLKE